jgi:TonB family protein
MRKAQVWFGMAALTAAAVWAAAAARPVVEFDALGGPLPAGAQVAGWEGKLRIFEGVKEGATAPAKVVTSSFLKYAFTVGLESELELESESAQIRKVFNLKEVQLLTESDLSWKRGLPETIAHVFRLDHKEYQVKLTTSVVGEGGPIRIQVLEQRENETASLLDTGFDYPKTQKNAVVFGFEDTQGQPYFISIRFMTLSAIKAVKAKSDVKPPKLLKMVDPVYPDEAKKAGKEGIVVIEATTDVKGNVAGAKILKPVDPALDQAALDAVKQWVYEPMMIKGQPKGVVFTVTIRFALEGKKDKGGVEGGVAGGVMGGVQGGVAGGVLGGQEEIQKKLDEFSKGAVKATGDIKPPKLLKEVSPVYPEDARQKGIEGVVILSAKTDESGRVVDTFVLRSVPGLNEAAETAVRQWVYEPMTIDGKAVPVVFTVTVRFQLSKEEEPGAKSGAVGGVVGGVLKEGKAVDAWTIDGILKKGIMTEKELEAFAQGGVVVRDEATQPKKVDDVAPKYPEKARQGRVEGLVVLLVRTDETGAVTAYKVARSIRVLDQAAIDAVTQWKYEPPMKDGKAVPAVFPVKVVFRLE